MNTINPIKYLNVNVIFEFLIDIYLIIYLTNIGYNSLSIQHFEEYVKKIQNINLSVYNDKFNKLYQSLSKPKKYIYQTSHATTNFIFTELLQMDNGYIVDALILLLILLVILVLWIVILVCILYRQSYKKKC